MRDIEQTIPFARGHTWYRIVGDIGSGVPLFVLHGGPGYPSHYLENLAVLANQERPVVFYDQLCCGRSIGNIEKDSWTLDMFVAQFHDLRRHLGVERAHLLGHSWGGFLALELALRAPHMFDRLVLASTSPSAQMFARAAVARMRTLPEDVVSVLEHGEATGNYEAEDYQRANKLFLAEFCDRVSPLPARLQQSGDEMNVRLYRHMWGPTEFTCNGTLSEWTVCDRLHEVTSPVLLTSGEYDEAGPEVQQFMLDHISNARWSKLDNSAHQSHITDETSFVHTVDTFLRAG